ncbi:MAG TPA: tetratricopeptide repeat protein [Thermodesulfobacteriota bacterium]|nr:tetratricopeptide repeat protein [Thermodesulfobacteriota bacterium]
MKKAIAFLIILILSLLYYMGVLTKKETLPFSKEFFSVESTGSADRAWDFKKGTSLGRKELDQLYQSKLDKGIRNVPVLTFFLIRESEQAKGRGESDQAVRMALYAVKFSPDLPQPYFELARALWHQSPFQLHKILPEVFKGELVRIGYYPTSVRFFYNMFYILCNAILMAFIIFGIVLMIKYYPLYFYDIRKNLTQEISRLLVNSAKIFLLFIPFFFRLDILWAILFWCILLWGYVTKREKQFILVFLIALAYLPFFLRSSSSFLDSSASDVIVEMNQANHEDWGKATEEKLRAWLGTHPNDPEVLFSLGLVQKRQGSYSEAEEFYRKAIQLDPKFSEAFSNLGNVYLAKRQTSSAIASYEQAADLNPNQGAYYYNLYRAYSQETFLSGRTDKAFQRARQLAPELVDYYTSIDTPNRPPNLNRLVIDEVLTPRRLWNRFLDNFIGKEGFLFRLFKAWFEKIPSRIPFLAPILFLGFLIGMSRYCRTKRFLTRCPMCGSPTYRFYLGTSDQEFICFNCYRIFIQKEKLHPKIVEKKSLQVRQFQKQNFLIGRFLSFFLVGFGYLWREQILKGFIFLSAFFVFILRFVYWNGVMPSPIPQLSTSFWRWIFWGGFFLLFYILSVRHLYRLKPKVEPESERPGGH